MGSQMAVRLTALRTGRALLLRNIIFLLLIFIPVRHRVNSRAVVRQEGLGKLKEIRLPHRVWKPRPSGM
jgi:hypothetical protein